MWIKVDDQVAHHPKILKAGPVGVALWLFGLAYCARYLTDGFIPAEAVSTLGDVAEPEAVTAKLVAAGLWEQVEDGYVACNYLEYNPSGAKVKEKRKREADRQAVQRESRRDSPVTTKGQTERSGRDLDPSISAPFPSSSPSIETSTGRDDAGTSTGTPKRRSHRGQAFSGARLDVPKFLDQEFDRALGARSLEFDLAAWYLALDAELVKSGEGFDQLPFLRGRFRADAKSRGFLAGADVVAGGRLIPSCRHRPSCRSAHECRDRNQAALHVIPEAELFTAPVRTT